MDNWTTDEWTGFKEGAGEAFNAEMGDGGATLNTLFPDTDGGNMGGDMGGGYGGNGGYQGDQG